MPGKALGGIRVLELCEMVAGPYCGRLLADMGADVVKVERPGGGGDPARRYGPFPGDIPHAEKSCLFLYVNLNKRGVTLDVETPTGRRLLTDLVRRADVVLEDRPPREAQRLGLDYSTLSAVNPRLIVTSVTPFGQTGPYANFKAHALNTFHAGGEGYFLPGGDWPGRPPVQGGGGFLGDYDSGLAAGIATIAALYDSAISGRGQHVDISSQEVLMALNGLDLTKWQNAGKVETRADRAPRLGSTLRCKDGYVEINVNFNHHWAALVRALGSPAWATDQRFAYYKGRLDNDREVRASFEAWSMSRTKREVMETLQANGCPAGAVNDPADVLASPQLQARDYFVEISHPKAGRYKYASAPWKLSATPARYERAAPLHGEHNADIFCRELGLTPAELADLRRAGVV